MLIPLLANQDLTPMLATLGNIVEQYEKNVEVAVMSADKSM